jgi:hypothetical protein
MEKKSVQSEEKSLKRLARLQQSESQKDEKAKSFQAESDELKLSSDILSTRQAIAEKEITIESLKNAERFVPKAIVDAQNELADLKAGLAALEELQEEMF